MATTDQQELDGHLEALRAVDRETLADVASHLTEYAARVSSFGKPPNGEAIALLAKVANVIAHEGEPG